MNCPSYTLEVPLKTRLKPPSDQPSAMGVSNSRNNFGISLRGPPAEQKDVRWNPSILTKMLIKLYTRLKLPTFRTAGRTAPPRDAGSAREGLVESSDISNIISISL